MIVKTSTNTLNIATAALVIMNFDESVSLEAFGLAVANLVFLAFTIVKMLYNNREHRDTRSLMILLLSVYNLIFDCLVIDKQIKGLPIDKTLHNMAIFIIGFNSLEFLSLNV